MRATPAAGPWGWGQPVAPCHSLGPWRVVCLDHLLAAQQDVLWLQVGVHQAQAVHEGHRLEQLPREAARLQGSAGQEAEVSWKGSWLPASYTCCFVPAGQHARPRRSVDQSRGQKTKRRKGEPAPLRRSFKAFIHTSSTLAVHVEAWCHCPCPTALPPAPQQSGSVGPLID